MYFAKCKSKFGVIVSKFQLNHLEFTVKLTSHKCETITGNFDLWFAKKFFFIGRNKSYHLPCG